MIMSKEDFILTQIAGDKLAIRTLILAGNKIKYPKLEDSVIKFGKLYDNVAKLLEEEVIEED